MQTDVWTQFGPYLMCGLAILGLIALVALIVVLVHLAGTMKNVKELAANANKDLDPVMKKVDPMMDRLGLTVDTVNLELLRIDGILEDVEDVTNIAGKAAVTVDNVAAVPSDAVAGITERIRGSIGTKAGGGAHSTKRFVYPVGKNTKKTDKDAEVSEETAKQADAITEAIEKAKAQQAQEQATADTAAKGPVMLKVEKTAKSEPAEQTPAEETPKEEE